MSDSEEELLILLLLNDVASKRIKNEYRQPKREEARVRKITRKRRRNVQLIRQELMLPVGIESYRRDLRMSESCFTDLLNIIKPDIQRQDTNMRTAITPAECLRNVLRFLATGESYRSIQSGTPMSLAYISQRFPEICASIYRNLKDQYLQFPSGAEWTNIAEKFKSRWHFPHCVGALDSKHIHFNKSKHDGELYHNYEGINSVLLLAMCDADYKLVFVDIGCRGRISDEDVLNQSNLREFLSEADNFLPNDTIIGNNRLLPHVIIGDDAFPLEKHFMTPYQNTTTEFQRSFNSRLDHARQSIEHTFGILSNRFRVLKSIIYLRPDKVVKVVQACCVLHNFLLMNSLNYAADYNIPEDSTGDDSSRNPKLHTNEAEQVRNTFAEYFSNEGKLKV